MHLLLKSAPFYLNIVKNISLEFTVVCAPTYTKLIICDWIGVPAEECITVWTSKIKKFKNQNSYWGMKVANLRMICFLQRYKFVENSWVNHSTIAHIDSYIWRIYFDSNIECVANVCCRNFTESSFMYLDKISFGLISTPSKKIQFSIFISRNLIRAYLTNPTISFLSVETWNIQQFNVEVWLANIERKFIMKYLLLSVITLLVFGIALGKVITEISSEPKHITKHFRIPKTSEMKTSEQPKSGKVFWQQSQKNVAKKPTLTFPAPRSFF